MLDPKPRWQPRIRCVVVICKTSPSARGRTWSWDWFVQNNHSSDTVFCRLCQADKLNTELLNQLHTLGPLKHLHTHARTLAHTHRVRSKKLNGTTVHDCECFCSRSCDDAADGDELHVHVGFSVMKDWTAVLWVFLHTYLRNNKTLHRPHSICVLKNTTSQSGARSAPFAALSQHWCCKDIKGTV